MIKADIQVDQETIHTVLQIILDPLIHHRVITRQIIHQEGLVMQIRAIIIPTALLLLIIPVIYLHIRVQILTIITQILTLIIQTHTIRTIIHQFIRIDTEIIWKM